MKSTSNGQKLFNVQVKNTYDEDISKLFIFIAASFLLVGLYSIDEKIGLYSFVFIGFVIAGYNLYIVYKINKKKSWVRIFAHIEKIEIIEHHIPNDSPTIRFYPQIKYTYQVDGVDYISDVYTSEVKYHWFNHLKEVKEVIHNNILDHQIKIYYNPRCPSEAVILNAVSIDEVGIPFFGVLFGFAISVLALYLLMFF